jgi:hypothetical protein
LIATYDVVRNNWQALGGDLCAHRIVLSGTPIQNNLRVKVLLRNIYINLYFGSLQLQEMWALFDSGASNTCVCSDMKDVGRHRGFDWLFSILSTKILVPYWYY